MNAHPPRNQFNDGAKPVNVEVNVETEQSALGRCLVRPELIQELAAKVREADFAEPLHARMFAAMVSLHGAGKTPSVETLAAMFRGEQIVDGLSVSGYLRRMAREAVVGAFLPFQDAVDAMREASARRRLVSVGESLALWSRGGRAITDLISDAVAELDDVSAASRDGKRLVYDGTEAADAAIANLDKIDDIDPTMGLDDLDRITGGWPRGQLSVLAGRPGMGKSAAAAGALRKAAAKGHAALFFSLEMTREQMGSRLLADIAFTASNPIYYEDILNRRIDSHSRGRLMDARDKLASLPISIQEERGISMAEISSRARKHAAYLDRSGHRLGVIFVDHIGLVQASGRYAGNRVREVAEISDGLATLAKELDTSVVALCQLNRGVEGRENKRPSLSDLRDSGAIEEDASTVTFLYRPAYYLENSREDDPNRELDRLQKLESVRHVLEFVVAKNRNGRTGVVRAFCNIGANAIRDAAYSR